MAKTKIPALDQISSYVDVVKSFRDVSRQCIWYKPASDERCTAEITVREMKLVFWLMRELLKAPSVELLERALLCIVENLCCDQWHRDLSRNSGFNERLALKWLHQLCADGTYTNCMMKFESMPVGNVDRKMTLRSASAHADTDIKVEADVSNNASYEVKVEAMEASRLSLLLGSVADQDDPTFRAHVRPPEENVASKLIARLSEKEREAQAKRETGFIYLFTQEKFPGMVKIGYTNGTVADRLKSWSKCGHGWPDLEESFDNVPCAHRVETLIHFEMISSWRKERYCRKHDSAHVEWFRTGTSEAVKVAGPWVEWMRRAKPYDDKGFLKDSWRGIIQELHVWEIPLTSRLLLDLQELEEHIQQKPHATDKATDCRQCEVLCCFEKHQHHPEARVFRRNINL